MRQFGNGLAEEESIYSGPVLLPIRISLLPNHLRAS